jgi:DNA-binding SARP family transcriptional activator/tetratricopeptide (TPR) repeat protein
MPEARLRLLGPVTVETGGHDVPLGPARQRTVLAALAVDAGRPVPLGTIIDRVWDEAPPAQVRSVLYTYVTRLRRALRGLAIVRRAGGGYVLDLDPGAVDLIQFGRLRAAGDLDRALELWRGPPLADLSGAWVSRTRDLATQQHLDAAIQWARARLTDGQAAAVAGRLRPLAADHPLVEPLAVLLVEALRRDGRAAEALDHFARVRRDLDDELGTEPGPDLRALHQQLLRPDAGRPASLPAGTGAFTGRDREIAALTEGVHAIAGMPGVGKTALAVHVAHRLRDRFDDGQLFVDLHGHTAGRDPADPADVLATLLTVDGVDPRQVPPGVEARSALWRSRTAGRRLVVVLDNAVDSAQVAPLLPAGGLVLVTSRRYLGDLPATTLALEVLSPAEAVHMFRRLAPAADGPVSSLVAACGHLPLAIALVARLVRRHPRWTIDDLLRETRSRLLHVTAEHANIHAAFDLSYQHLPPPAQAFFRGLARHPGTEFEPHAAAALTGTDPATAVARLDALHADSLLIETAHRRYVMHDLIRAYARGLADPGVPDELLDLYQRGGDLAWLRTERANILACLAATTDDRRVVALTAALAEVLRRDGPWERAIELHTAAIAAAAQQSDRARALVELATVRRLGGDYPGAERDIRHAIRIYHRTGDEDGEAAALTVLAKTLSRAARYLDSLGVVERALELHRARGDENGAAAALVEEGIARGMTSDFEAARRLLGQALDIYRRHGDAHGIAYARRILGIAHGRVGAFVEARVLLIEALADYRRLGSRLGEALTRTDLGRTATGLGELGTAIRELHAALDQFREIHHRSGRSMALLYLGGALRRAGDLPGARDALVDALALDRELGNRSGEAMVLNELGAVHLRCGEVDQAVKAHQEARRLADLVPSAWDRAQSLAGLGRCALALGSPEEGTDQLRTALGLFREIHAAEAAEVESEIGFVT